MPLHFLLEVMASSTVWRVNADQCASLSLLKSEVEASKEESESGRVDISTR